MDAFQPDPKGEYYSKMAADVANYYNHRRQLRGPQILIIWTKLDQFSWYHHTNRLASKNENKDEVQASLMSTYWPGWKEHIRDTLSIDNFYGIPILISKSIWLIRSPFRIRLNYVPVCTDRLSRWCMGRQIW
jgi:hypothetical protein